MRGGTKSCTRCVIRGEIMERRLIFAVALSILVVVSFQFYASKAYPPKAQAPFTPTESPARPLPQEIVSAEMTAQKEAPLKEEEFRVETDRHKLTFSNIGGAIKEIRLKGFKSGDGKSALELAKPASPRSYILSLDDPLRRIDLATSAYRLREGRDIVVYTLETDALEITKRYILHNSKDIIELRLTIRNKSGASKDLVYRVISGSGMTEPEQADKRFVEVVSKIDGKIIKFRPPKGGRIINPGGVSWSALKSKYFSLILKPYVDTKSEFYEAEAEGLVAGIEVKDFSLPALSFVDHNFTLYAGPADVQKLQALGLGLEESVDYGAFGSISRMLLSVMKFLYKVFHNWGVAIILLAVLLNLVLFPLTKKSFSSMAKMQSLQPEMAQLKSQHKDNPQKLNKEMMELYKKYKINPFSGCLPLLLQMPIFLALYQALSRAVDLKHAHFLWIRDLSLPEGIKIPFKLPLIGNSINILPILMAVAMVMQQRLSSASMAVSQTDEQKQQQKMMMVMMPVMFGFVFYNMPSGLVLYWFVSTILTTLEQLLLFKKPK